VLRFDPNRGTAQPGVARFPTLRDSTAVRIADSLSLCPSRRIGVYGFFSSRSLDAFFLEHSQVLFSRKEASEKSVDESRFSDACLRGGQRRVSLGPRKAWRDSVAKLRQAHLPGPTISLGAEAWEEAAFSSLTGAIRVIPSWKRSQYMRLFFGIVANSLAEFRECIVRVMHFRTFTYSRASRPQDLILRDETFRGFTEINEYVKSPGSEATRSSARHRQCSRCRAGTGLEYASLPAYR